MIQGSMNPHQIEERRKKRYTGLGSGRPAGHSERVCMSHSGDVNPHLMDNNVHQTDMQEGQVEEAVLTVHGICADKENGWMQRRKE
jgi:hypothetical protein